MFKVTQGVYTHGLQTYNSLCCMYTSMYSMQCIPVLMWRRALLVCPTILVSGPRGSASVSLSELSIPALWWATPTCSELRCVQS